MTYIIQRIFIIAFTLFMIFLFILFDIDFALSLKYHFILLYFLFYILCFIALYKSRFKKMKFFMAILFLISLIIIRNIQWNSRKVFIKKFNQLNVGMSLKKTDEIMSDFIIFRTESVDTLEKNKAVHIISYRHTNEGWGNSDMGIVYVQNDTIIRLKFYHD